MHEILQRGKCTVGRRLYGRRAGGRLGKTSLPTRNVSADRRFKEAGLLLLIVLLLLLLFLVVLLLLSGSLLAAVLLTLGCGSISGLLAWPLLELLLPDGVQGLSADDLPATLVQLLPVLVGPCVGPPLVLGVHADHGGVLANKGFRVKTLLQGLLSQLGLLPLLQLLKVPLLLLPLLLVVVLVGLQLNDNVEQLGGLSLQVVGVHGVEFKGLDSDGEGNLLLLLQLLLGLGHLLAGIIALSASSGLLGCSAGLVG